MHNVEYVKATERKTNQTYVFPSTEQKIKMEKILSEISILFNIFPLFVPRQKLFGLSKMRA